MIAAWSMYDWPEIEVHTDRLWGALRDALLEAGLDPPADRTRDDDFMHVWTAPNLLFAQTCGLPYSRFLIDQVTLIGTPHYACEGCEGPNYSSAIVVRHDSEIEKLHESVGLTVAFNEPWSQSGRGAWHRLSLVGRKKTVFGRVLKTGAHRASLRAVAAGEADICAVDAVCWALFQRYDPEPTAKLRVLEWTEKTPGLPVISHAGLSEDDRSKIQVVFEHVISNLDTPTKDSLMLSGFTRTSESDYRPLAETLAQATAEWDPLLGALSDKTSSSLG